jgi:hypothetical protein
MEQEESIYNLIPPEEYKAQKPKRYKSKHDPQMAPTGSNFCLKTTSKPNVSNLGGEVVPQGSNHLNTACFALWGKKKGEVKPDPARFTKKEKE